MKDIVILSHHIENFLNCRDIGNYSLINTYSTAYLYYFRFYGYFFFSRFLSVWLFYSQYDEILVEFHHHLLVNSLFCLLAFTVDIGVVDWSRMPRCRQMVRTRTRGLENGEWDLSKRRQTNESLDNQNIDTRPKTRGKSEFSFNIR